MARKLVFLLFVIPLLTYSQQLELAALTVDPELADGDIHQRGTPAHFEQPHFFHNSWVLQPRTNGRVLRAMKR